MSHQLIKDLAEGRPSPEAAQGLVAPLIQRLEAVKAGPGEAKALGNRMKNDASSASDRHRLLEILEAEEAALAFLLSWTPPSLPGQGHGRAKRNQPRGKRSGGRRRRERTGGLTGHWCCVTSPCGPLSPCGRCAVCSGEGSAMSHEQAQQVQQSLDEGQSLRQRLGPPQGREADWGRVDGVWATDERMRMALWAAQLSLQRLGTLVFGTRRRRKSAGSGISSGDEAAATDRSADDVWGEQERQSVDTRGESGEGWAPDDVKPPRTGGHRPGDGRLGADASAGAERVECRHEELAAGQRGPGCGQGGL